MLISITMIPLIELYQNVNNAMDSDRYAELVAFNRTILECKLEKYNKAIEEGNIL